MHKADWVYEVDWSRQWCYFTDLYMVFFSWSIWTSCRMITIAYSLNDAQLYQSSFEELLIIVDACALIIHALMQSVFDDALVLLSSVSMQDHMGEYLIKDE